MRNKSEVIARALVILNKIVVTSGCDRGVVLLSSDGPCHYDAELKCQVYDHENFSPLGDALIELHDTLTFKPVLRSKLEEGQRLCTRDTGLHSATIIKKHYNTKIKSYLYTVKIKDSEAVFCLTYNQIRRAYDIKHNSI